MEPALGGQLQETLVPGPVFLPGDLVLQLSRDIALLFFIFIFSCLL